VTTAPRRVGIVGAGWAGAQHARSLRGTTVAGVVALALACEEALASGGSAAVRPRSAQREEALQ
jgi:predicted dehydrogenase